MHRGLRASALLLAVALVMGLAPSMTGASLAQASENAPDLALQFPDPMPRSESASVPMPTDIPAVAPEGGVESRPTPAALTITAAPAQPARAMGAPARPQGARPRFLWHATCWVYFA